MRANKQLRDKTAILSKNEDLVLRFIEIASVLDPNDFGINQSFAALLPNTGWTLPRRVSSVSLCKFETKGQ